MATEVTGWRKLTQFVAYHVFSDKNRDKRFAVVNRDGFAHHIGDDHRGAAPGFDDLFAIALFRFAHFCQQGVMDVGAFF